MYKVNDLDHIHLDCSTYEHILLCWDSRTSKIQTNIVRKMGLESIIKIFLIHTISLKHFVSFPIFAIYQFYLLLLYFFLSRFKNMGKL